jgi:hypothetical protein
MLIAWLGFILPAISHVAGIRKQGGIMPRKKPEGKATTVISIVYHYLKRNGYNGLCTEGCGCLLDDLAPCCDDISHCIPGYAITKREAVRRGIGDENDRDDTIYVVPDKEWKQDGRETKT